VGLPFRGCGEEVQREATYVTASNEHRGFAQAVEESSCPGL
jgi:hypothetical protein